MIILSSEQKFEDTKGSKSKAKQWQNKNLKTNSDLQNTTKKA